MIWILISTLLVTFAYMLFAPSPEKRRARKLKPHEVEWGNSKVLSDLRRTPLDELEQWWQANESKDARIRQLEAALKQSELDLFKAKTVVRRGNDLYKQVAVPTLSDPAKVVVIPNKMSYYNPNTPTQVALKVEGDLANKILNPEVITTLTIRGGKVTDWNQSW